MKHVTQTYTVFWFRRDLRLADNAGLCAAIKHASAHSNAALLPMFIYDTDILNNLVDRDDARVNFIHECIESLRQQLHGFNIPLLTFHGRPTDVIEQLTKELAVECVFANHDYEPSAIARDGAVDDFLAAKNIKFFTCKDQCIFEKGEVTKDDGLPYTVFTAYKNKWLKNLKPSHLAPYPSEKWLQELNGQYNFNSALGAKVDLKNLGFTASKIALPERKIKTSIIKNYDKTRNTPSVDGTSRLGVHLRFGTISIRRCVEIAEKTNEVWLSELIWRDFFMQILWHFPKVVNAPFRPAYANIHWRNNKSEFEAWCQGQTGYALVDAGMRELNATGHMHNRVRMVTASFLTKHLLIDWRWGEKYFARRLLDFDLAANNGNWQWAAGTGCDAAPYFRIFNPLEQQKKFDPKFAYIEKWVPEYKTEKYLSLSIVDHRLARTRALEAYGVALKSSLTRTPH